MSGSDCRYGHPMRGLFHSRKIREDHKAYDDIWNCRAAIAGDWTRARPSFPKTGIAAARSARDQAMVWGEVSSQVYVNMGGMG